MIKKGYLLLLTGLLFLLGSFTISCTSDLEQQEIISFTRQALEIEGNQSELMEYFARQHVGPLREHFFLEGMPADAGYPKWMNAPESGLEGMVSLRKRLLFLDCPQSLQSIKQSLLEIYQLEIELAESEGETMSLSEAMLQGVAQYKTAQEGFLPHQERRKDTYTHWAEILREHGIDPAEGGFSGLIEQ